MFPMEPNLQWQVNRQTRRQREEAAARARLFRRLRRGYRGDG